MIYVVPQRLQEEGFNVIFGDRKKVIIELINKGVNQDTLLGVDDFIEQRQVLNYLGLNYKVVIGIPNLSADEQIMYETASNHLIDFTEFNSIVKKETKQEEEVTRFLTHEDDVNEPAKTER